jgi:hypothetical protein
MLRQWLIGLGTIGVLAASTVAVDAATDLPVVDSSALGTSRNLPWSEPVHSPYGTLSNFTCSELINSRNVTQLFMRIGDQIFQVSEQNSTFPVDDALAQALQTAPTENIRIRLVTEAGEIVDSEIGQETVEAWKTVYAN